MKLSNVYIINEEKEDLNLDNQLEVALIKMWSVFSKDHLMNFFSTRRKEFINPISKKEFGEYEKLVKVINDIEDKKYVIEGGKVIGAWRKFFENLGMSVKRTERGRGGILLTIDNHNISLFAKYLSFFSCFAAVIYKDNRIDAGFDYEYDEEGEPEIELLQEFNNIANDMRREFNTVKQ